MPVRVQPRRALVAEAGEIIRQREAFDLGVKSEVVRTQELYESESDRGISLRAALAEAAHQEMQLREASLDRRQRSVRYRKRSPISGRSLQPARVGRVPGRASCHLLPPTQSVIYLNQRGRVSCVPRSDQAEQGHHHDTEDDGDNNGSQAAQAIGKEQEHQSYPPLIGIHRDGE